MGIPTPHYSVQKFLNGGLTVTVTACENKETS